MTSTKIRQFQGTSQAGDFPSALNEAINVAFDALCGNISDCRLTWKVIEVSGSSGGISGERAITVTIEAQQN
jgi:hypothetical protein